MGSYLKYRSKGYSGQLGCAGLSDIYNNYYQQKGCRDNRNLFLKIEDCVKDYDEMKLILNQIGKNVNEEYKILL